MRGYMRYTGTPVGEKTPLLKEGPGTVLFLRFVLASLCRVVIRSSAASVVDTVVDTVFFVLHQRQRVRLSRLPLSHPIKNGVRARVPFANACAEHQSYPGPASLDPINDMNCGRLML